MTGERLISVNGIDLCVDTFGDAADPVILLLAGMNSSMDGWEPEFCERLASGRRYVIRYDHRDTGRSVSYPPGTPRYSGDDLRNDAVGLLDALGLAQAHVAGISMGGAIAQLVALDHPARVASLTLISTTAGPGDPDLPPASEGLQAHFAKADRPDWSDQAAVIDYIVEDYRPYAARSHPFDATAVRNLAERVVDRTINIESSMTNHGLLEDGAGRWRERLGELSMPTLVIHGDEDPLFPLAHGRALAMEIPNARLVVMEQTGHELPRRAWDVVVPAILEHTRAGDPLQ